MNYFHEDAEKSVYTEVIEATNSGYITEEPEQDYSILQAEKDACKAKRIAIANRMWRDYTARRTHAFADL